MNKINVIYLLPELKGPSGGAKVIYKNSLILNKVNQKVESKILYVKKKLMYKLQISLAKKIKLKNFLLGGWDGKKMKESSNFLPNKSWFKGKIKFAKNLNFQSSKDFIIIPEIFAHFAVDLDLKNQKIKYAILVQGSYHMNSTEDYDKLYLSYKNANLILVTSIEAKKFIENIFPTFKNKIFKIKQSINSSQKKIVKKNYITCMPKKLPAHFHLLKFFIKDQLPKNWKIDILENISENQLEYKINRSKIFLSFSHLEGFGLPPLEAALAKNKVIGYVGGGGDEYWKKPMFHEVKYGDINSFGKTLLREIKNYSKSWIENTKKERIYLSKKYSMLGQEKCISTLSKKILSFYS